MSQLATDSIVPVSTDTAYFRKVFAWMGAGLVVTGAVAGGIGHSQRALNALITGNGTWLLIACILVELLLVGALVGLVQHMGVYEAAAVFLGYAGLNGVTLSIVFAAFTTKSIYATFFVTAGMFGALALAGYVTSIDLTRWGSFLFMALVGQLIGLVVNIFWLNDTLYWVTTATGVLIFSAYTAYDVQRLKKYEVEGDAAAVEEERNRRCTGAVPRLREPLPVSAADLRPAQVSA